MTRRMRYLSLDFERAGCTLAGMSTAKKHLFQYRRKEPRVGRRDPMYTPERDLAHVGPGLVKGAMVSLEPQFWEPWLKEYMDQNGITYDVLLETEAPLKFAKAINRIMTAENPVVALAAEDFTDLPHPIQMLFYTRLGQVFLCGVWAAVKDVGMADDAPPASFQELLDDVNEAFTQFLDEDEDHGRLPQGNGTAAEETLDAKTTNP